MTATRPVPLWTAGILESGRTAAARTVKGMTHRAPAPQPSAARRLLDGLSTGFSPGLSLGLPVSCAGCGRWETTLCPQCRELLESEPFTVEHAEARATSPSCLWRPTPGRCAPWSWGGRTAHGRT